MSTYFVIRPTRSELLNNRGQNIPINPLKIKIERYILNFPHTIIVKPT